MHISRAWTLAVLAVLALPATVFGPGVDYGDRQRFVRRGAAGRHRRGVEPRAD